MPGRLAIVFILMTVMIDAMGIGLIIPVMPDLIGEVTGDGLSRAAIWSGMLATSFAVMQFVFGPALGVLSDRIGRRPVLVFALGFMAVDYVLMALAHSVWLLLLGRLIGGITAATIATASASMADLSAPEKKSSNFALIGAAAGLGFVLGPMLGGLLAELGTRAPFVAAAILAFANMMLGWAVMPETIGHRKSRHFSLKRLNPFFALRNVWGVPGLSRYIVILFLYQVAFYAYPAIWAFYAKANFDWREAMIGFSLGFYGLSIVLVQSVVIRRLLKRVGENQTLCVGLAVNLVSFVLLAQIESGMMALALVPFIALGAIVTPAMQGIASHMTCDRRQGEMMGVLTSVTAMAAIVSPLLMSQSFAFFTAPEREIFAPGAPFALAAVLVGIALVMTAYVPQAKIRANQASPQSAKLDAN